jgi:hypothetical protein
MRRAVTSSCTLPHWLTIVWRPSSGSGPLRDSRHSAGSGRPGAPPSSPGGIRAPRPARLPPATCAVSRDRIHRHGRRALATCRWTRTPAPRQSQMTLPTAGERVQVSAHQHRKLRRSPGGPVMPGAICLYQQVLLMLWGAPRSRSTAFFRMMAERGDFVMVHEPFSYLAESGYASIAGERITSAGDLTGALGSLARNGRVFVKETTGRRYPEVLQDSLPSPFICCRPWPGTRLFSGRTSGGFPSCASHTVTPGLRAALQPQASTPVTDVPLSRRGRGARRPGRGNCLHRTVFSLAGSPLWR